eukprot:6713799-Alexandrium_andersonii.AAC.1
MSIVSFWAMGAGAAGATAAPSSDEAPKVTIDGGNLVWDSTLALKEQRSLACFLGGGTPAKVGNTWA